MEIETAVIIAGGGMLVGWFSKAYAFGKKEQKRDDRLESVEKNQVKNIASIKDLNVLVVTLNQELKIYHDKDLKELRASLVTPAGGQKFITFPDHDVICDRNSRTIVASLAALTKVISENTAEVKNMRDEFHLIKVDVAVLKERRTNGSRHDDHLDMNGVYK